MVTLKINICLSKNETSFDISMFLNELVFVGPEKTNLADFIIVQIQVQIHVVEKESLPVMIFEK